MLIMQSMGRSLILYVDISQARNVGCIILGTRETWRNNDFLYGKLIGGIMV